MSDCQLHDILMNKDKLQTFCTEVYVNGHAVRTPNECSRDAVQYPTWKKDMEGGGGNKPVKIFTQIYGLFADLDGEVVIAAHTVPYM